MAWGIVQSAFHTATVVPLAVLFFLTLRRTGKTVVEWTYFALLASALLWISMDYVSSQLTLAGQPIPLLSIVAEIGLLGICLSIYGFCEHYQGSLMPSSRHWRIAAAASGSLFVIPLYFSEKWMHNFRVVDGAPQADTGVHYLLSGAWSVALLTTGFTILWLKSRRNPSSTARTKLRFLFWGTVLPALIAVVTNYVLPLFGTFFYTFIPTDIGLLYWSMLVYALLFKQPANLKKAFVEWFTRLFGAVVLLVILYLVLSLFYTRVPSMFYYAVFAFLTFVGGFAFSKILPIFQSAENRRPLDTWVREISVLAGEKPEQAARRLAELLRDRFQCAPVSIVFVSDGELREVVIDRKSPIPLRREDKILLTRLFSRKSLPEDAILKPIDAFIKDSASHALVRRGLAEYLHFMDRQGFPVVTPLRRGKSWCGFILLGSRTDGSSLSSSQKLYLENISHFAGLVFSAQSPAQSVREWKPKVEAGDDVRRISVGDRVLVFRSERMHEWYDTLGSLSAVSFPVLITGETGTGKEMAARLMHELGPRKTEPFVAINCAAIPENLWEDEIFGHVRGAYTDAKGDRSGRVHQAAGGILFFDEIGEMPPEIQPKMLRLLQDRTYTPLGSTQSERAECRFIFATNRQLGDTDSKRSFRSDLLYRINVLRLQLPPLRERKTDIPLLLSHYMEKYSREFGVPEKHLEEGAILRLVSYEWPGNVRELENIIVGLLAGSRHPAITAREVDRILSGHATSEKPVFPLRLEEHLDKIAGRLVEKALAESDGNKSKAARLLGLTRGQLLYRMREALRD